MTETPQIKNDVPDIVIITGLSGSGMSSATNAFQDLGYFCVDNLPVTMLPTFGRLVTTDEYDKGIRRAALVIDIREGRFLADFEKQLNALRESGLRVTVLFFEASDEVLQYRFSETRRPHPADKGQGLLTAIRTERQAMAKIRSHADQIIEYAGEAVEALSVDERATMTNMTPLHLTDQRPSVAFFMQAPFPMELYQSAELVVFEMEYFDLVRVVFLDGREHPPPTAPHSRSGHSVGHWEGDTLVVDTTHIAPGTFMNNGFNHSDQLHMVERFRSSPDGGTLWLTQLYEDAPTFEGLAARYMAWTRRPGEYVYPYDCDPSYGD